jgi:hypothetical protein
MNRFMQRCALLLAILPSAGCDTFGSNNSDFLRQQLTRAEQRWDSAGSNDYTLVLTRRCDCGVEPRQVALEVVANEVVGGMYTDTSEPLDATSLSQQMTVDEMFDLAHDAVDRRVPIVLVQYNQEFGYIDDLVINYDQTRVDDDVLIVVDDYIPADP